MRTTACVRATQPLPPPPGNQRHHAVQSDLIDGIGRERQPALGGFFCHQLIADDRPVADDVRLDGLRRDTFVVGRNARQPDECIANIDSQRECETEYEQTICQSALRLPSPVFLNHGEAWAGCIVSLTTPPDRDSASPSPSHPAARQRRFRVSFSRRTFCGRSAYL